MRKLNRCRLRRCTQRTVSRVQATGSFSHMWHAAQCFAWLHTWFFASPALLPCSPYTYGRVPAWARWRAVGHQSRSASCKCPNFTLKRWIPACQFICGSVGVVHWCAPVWQQRPGAYQAVVSFCRSQRVLSPADAVGKWCGMQCPPAGVRARGSLGSAAALPSAALISGAGQRSGPPAAAPVVLRAL